MRADYGWVPVDCEKSLICDEIDLKLEGNMKRIKSKLLKQANAPT